MTSAWALMAVMPFLTAALLATGSGRTVKILPPASAVRLLTALSLITALACGYVLAVAAFWALGQIPTLAALGGWSAPVLRRSELLPPTVGAALGVLVLGLLAASAARAATHLRELRTAQATCRQLGSGIDGLIVVDSAEPDAYTLSRLSSRIIVTTAMLKALPPAERRALLAHEASHRRHRHHAYNQLTDLAAAANPLLRSTARAVRWAVERWADEDAASEVNDRATTARAIARAGLARSSRRTAGAGHLPTTVTAAVALDVAARARALLASPPRRRPIRTGLLVLLIAVVAASTVMTSRGVERRFEQARSAHAIHLRLE